MRRVPFIMTSLAKSAAASGISVAFIVIHVGNRQDHFAAGLRVLLGIVSAAVRVLRRAFTAVSSAKQDKCPERLPLFRIDRPTRVSLHLL